MIPYFCQKLASTNSLGWFFFSAPCFAVTACFPAVQGHPLFFERIRLYICLEQPALAPPPRRWNDLIFHKEAYRVIRTFLMPQLEDWSVLYERKAVSLGAF